MNFNSPITLLYHTYNSLFLSLPFHMIEETGTHLALFGQHVDAGFKKKESPVEIIDSFWKEYFEHMPEPDRMNTLFNFIQYIERQVVLFDSVEDALFEQTHEMNGRGSVRHLMSRLDTEALREAMHKKIGSFNLRLVLTAHPTQFYPGKVLGIIHDLGKEIKANNLQQIRLLLMQLGKTGFMNREKPTPLSEAVGLGWYMENVFYHAIPDVLFRLLRHLKIDPTTFENPRLLSLGFWPGGDRDGNPFVRYETTLDVAALLRKGALRGYYRDIRLVRRRLSFRYVEERIALVEAKLYNTLFGPGPADKAGIYASCGELLQDLGDTRAILLKEHQDLFLDELDRPFIDDLDLLILKVRTFGFYFASLDIRQESKKHTEVWKKIRQVWEVKLPGFSMETFHASDETAQITQLLTVNTPLDESDFDDDLVLETLRTFKAIAEIQKQNGEPGCHRYIISNCESALNVAEVLALAQLTIGRAAPLDVVPLFETIDDLAVCDTVMETLYTNDSYARHLATRGQVQHIMLGFSDGTKDGGYLRANWSIYRAKEALTRISRRYGVTVIFFDGRGGPPGRGGGNNASYYAAHGKDIENKAIHVTIQGQTVSSTYGTLPAARLNIEQLLTAGLENFLFHAHDHEMTDEDRKLLDELADSAYTSYLELKNHPQFVPYLEKRTPLKWYGDTNIASRPTKRSGGTEMRFEDLRAIPFVGAWAQMKQNIPGFYGVGSALSGESADHKQAIEKLYDHSLFFRTLLENSMQSLSKSNFKVTAYMEQDDVFGSFWKMLKKEYDDTYAWLLELSGQRELLSSNPMSQSSIALREDIVLPLIAIQQFALQKLQEEDISPEMAEICRKLVLRAMFGIINAARNAA
jgi:phosphoenolpyruvate carboxylase